MDPVSWIGLTSSIVGIVDVLTQSIISLRNLQKRWQGADFTATFLVGQLTALKAALTQISDWSKSANLITVPQHYQFPMDLESTLECSKTLVIFIDRQLSRLELDETHSLTFESRLKAVLDNSGIKECANHLNNQSTALNLLLTAFNW